MCLCHVRSPRLNWRWAVPPHTRQSGVVWPHMRWYMLCLWFFPCSVATSALSPTLSGPVLRDTARLSQRYPPIARCGVFGVSTWPIGCDTPSSFSERFPLESMRSGGAIPPHQRGISAILAWYPMKTRQNVCDTPPLRYDLERVLRDMGGYLALGRWGPTSPQFAFPNHAKGLKTEHSTLWRDPSGCGFAVVSAHLPKLWKASPTSHTSSTHSNHCFAQVPTEDVRSKEEGTKTKSILDPIRILLDHLLEGPNGHRQKGHREKHPENTLNIPWKCPENTLKTPWKCPEIHDFQYFLPSPLCGVWPLHPSKFGEVVQKWFKTDPNLI